MPLTVNNISLTSDKTIKSHLAVLIAHKKYVAQQIYLMQIYENLKLKKTFFCVFFLPRICKSVICRWGGGGGIEFLKFLKKRVVVQVFLQIKLEGLFKKSGRVSLIFILTNPFQSYLSLSVSCVCMCVCVCVLFIYTPSISNICVSQDEPSLIASNQQIQDFSKKQFEKK